MGFLKIHRTNVWNNFKNANRLLSISVPADSNGLDLNPVQDTPVATRKEDTYIHFGVEVEIQRHVEKLAKGKTQTSPEI